MTEQISVDPAQVIEMRKAGKTYDQIATALGCTRGKVQWIITSNGAKVEIPQPPLSELWA